MGKTKDQVAAPRRKRHEAAGSLMGTLDQQVEKVVLGSDWRRRYQQSPGLFLLAAALGGGLLVAMAAGTRKSPAGRVIDGGNSAAPRPAVGGARDMAFEAVKGALIGIAVSQAKGMVSQLLSGFAGHLTKAPKASHPAEHA